MPDDPECDERPGLHRFGDEELRRGVEALFFAYRAFTADPDRILAARGLGRAHHRAVHFINRHPGVTVTALLDILGVTKQALNRVLRTLIEDGLVRSTVGTGDRRERNLHLTATGVALERELSEAQHERVGAAFDRAGTAAVAGFRAVLEAMMDDAGRRHFAAPGEGQDRAAGAAGRGRA
ncbi:MAG: MarR family transcriptional regulator [Rubellimicrobium sp.]|nr:MarR family transcriptional regulator [Rubellimicrobium sp.]